MLKQLSFFLLVMLLAPMLKAQTIEECDSLIVAGVKLMNEKDYVHSLEIHTRVKAVAQEKNWHKQHFLALNNIGANYFWMLDYGEALNYYLEAYKIAINELDEYYEMTILNNIAIIYAKEKQFNKAHDYFKMAYSIAEKQDAKRQMGLYATNLGMVANDLGNITQARDYLDKAQSLLQDDAELMLNVEIAQANNFFLQGQLDKARDLAKSILLHLDEPKYSEYNFTLNILLSKIFEKKNDYHNAISFAQNALGFAANPDLKIDCYKRISEIYSHFGFPEPALIAKDSLISAIEQYNLIKNGRLFETNRVKFEIQNYQRELQENKEKLKAQRKAFFGALSVALLIIILITWALRNNYIKSKQRKIIHARSEEIMALELEKNKTENILLEKQFLEKETNARLELEQLKNEIEKRNRQLASKALHALNRNELIEEILSSIDSQPEIKNNLKLKTHIQQLKNHLHNDAEWDSFLTHFEEVNQHFLNSLKTKHQSLNSNDIRFLCYIYINLSIKEISLLLNITPEACRKRKERITTKMGLPDNSDLYNYISGI